MSHKMVFVKMSHHDQACTDSLNLLSQDLIINLASVAVCRPVVMKDNYSFNF